MNTAVLAVENVAKRGDVKSGPGPTRDPIAEKKRRKKSMSSRDLKQHLRYLVPEMRLALIKEPAKAPPAIRCPEDIDLFIEPLKHYADFVPHLIMCRHRQTLRCGAVSPEGRGT